MPVVELEHRHRFLIGQRGMWATKAFESFFVETTQPIIKRLIFGMRSRNERHSATRHYVEIITWHIGLLGVRIESDIGVADMDGVAFDIKLLLLRSNLYVSKSCRRDRCAVKMYPLDSLPRQIFSAWYSTRLYKYISRYNRYSDSNSLNCPAKIITPCRDFQIIPSVVPIIPFLGPSFPFWVLLAL